MKLLSCDSLQNTQSFCQNQLDNIAILVFQKLSMDDVAPM